MHIQKQETKCVEMFQREELKYYSSSFNPSETFN